MSSQLQCARACLRARTVGNAQIRNLAQKPTGHGGISVSDATLNPAAQARANRYRRLRAAHESLQERAQDELSREEREEFEDERDIRNYVEGKICQAMQDGEFDNLRNKGKPLSERKEHTLLDTYNRIMKEQGFRPPWVELMHQIDEEKRVMRVRLKAAWSKQTAWHAALADAQSEIEHINRAVDQFNLTRPHRVRHLFRLRVRIEEEVARAKGEPIPPRTSLPASTGARSEPTVQSRAEQTLDSTPPAT